MRLNKYNLIYKVALPLAYQNIKKLSIMKKVSIIIAAVIVFAASSCAPSYMCPTYTKASVQEVPAQQLDQNNL